jgi:hypothetical protein
MLPSLANLSLKCRSCGPVGETFEEFEDAQGSVGPVAERRPDWSPDAWGGERSPDCPICQEPLHRRARGGAGASKEVEALFENPACSHCFHRECLEQWIQGALRGTQIIDRNLRCPTCSRPIDQSILDTVFDASANVNEVAEDDGFAAEGQAQQQAAVEEAAAESANDALFGGNVFPLAVDQVLARYATHLADNGPNTHGVDAYNTIMGLLRLRYEGEGQVPDNVYTEYVESYAREQRQASEPWKVYLLELIAAFAGDEQGFADALADEFA